MWWLRMIATYRPSNRWQVRARSPRKNSRTWCFVWTRRKQFGSCFAAGESTETAITRLTLLLASGDIIIDGGNSYWKDDIRRATALKERGLHYVDVGTSGGIWGLERGFCMMIGGEANIVRHLDPVFSALAPGAGELPRISGREARDARA